MSTVSSASTAITYEQWEDWVKTNLPPHRTLSSVERYFRSISESEYLSQNFLKFPALLQRELVDQTVYNMSLESIEDYARLYYNMPDSDRSLSAIIKNFTSKIRRSAKSDTDKRFASDLIETINEFAAFHITPESAGLYSCYAIAAIALLHQHSTEVMNTAMREWIQNSKTTELHHFVEFVEVLATSDYPPEWTVSVMQWKD